MTGAVLLNSPTINKGTAFTDDEAHGGRLWATPNAPRGAVFHISLPIEQPAPIAAG